MVSVHPSSSHWDLITNMLNPRVGTPKRLPCSPLQPQDITVKDLEMQDMLWSTMRRRNTKTQATKMTVHTPNQQAPAHVSRQRSTLLGDGQWRHVAPVAEKSDEDRVFSEVCGMAMTGRTSGSSRSCDTEKPGQLDDTTAPGAPHVLLAGPHLLDAH
ncbi:hypothetical protein P7K49_001112 [Saguinus oedipus]|uniref:Uncharacterized protein n=1 Tax=Saguinus oedipus TaxID=9490 RepID=A0ABQ9WDM3_SAGOE|nr:hypothetical protein P7K49_001112 [Saguinus oedipus]